MVHLQGVVKVHPSAKTPSAAPEGMGSFRLLFTTLTSCRGTRPPRLSRGRAAWRRMQKKKKKRTKGEPANPCPAGPPRGGQGS